MSIWTAERDAAITKMIGENISLTKIAEAIGLHRRTLTERVDRLGLSRPKGAELIDWNDDNTAELKRLWNMKMSGRAIAAALGVSKNAVIGKANRLQLEARQRAPAADKPRKRHKRGVNTTHKRNAFDKVFAPVAFVPRIVDIAPLNLALVDLQENSCRYPGEETPITFCGLPKQKASSYCPTHHALCWKPRQEINREQFHQTRIERARAYKAELVA